MSETVKVGRNRPPQNGWASKEEVDKLRAEVAELRETNQMMLEEIKGLRAELGGAKRRHFLGAVATSAAAFFGKFFHRGEDLGDIPEEKLGKRENRKGAHAKGKEKEKEKEKEKGGAPIVPARRDEKSKISREQKDKRNKNKTPGGWKKALVGTLVATLAIGSAVYAFNPHKGAQDLPKDPSTAEANAGDLRMPETEQALAEQAVEADLQNKANEMGMSVESMKRLADEHGMPYDKIGTDEAQHYLSDQLVAKNNIAEPFDASTPEKAKESLSFYVYNHKDVCAEFYAALHENPEGEVDGLENPQDTIDYSEQFKKNDAAFDAARKEVIGALNEDGTEVTVREATDRTVTTFHKIHEQGSDNGTLGVGENKENSNGMNEKVVVTNFANRGITTWTKVGCAQNAAPVTRVVREAVVTPKQAKQGGGEQKQEHHREAQGELRKEEHGQEEGERRTPPSDAKDEHADDPQEDPENKVTETPKSTDQAEASEDKQADKNGDGLPDSSGKSKSNNGEDDIKGKQGDTGEDRPANKNNTEADNGGSGSGEHVAGGGNQGGSGEGGTGSNKADSGGGGKETSQNSQEGSSSWIRKWGSKESSSWTIGSDGKKVESSESSSYDTGRVERNGDSNDAAGGNVELQQSSSVPTSVPISQED